MPRSITERQMEAMRAFAAEMRQEKAALRENARVKDARQVSNPKEVSSPSCEALPYEHLQASLAEAAPQVRDLLKSFEEAQAQAAREKVEAAKSASVDFQALDDLAATYLDEKIKSPIADDEGVAPSPTGGRSPEGIAPTAGAMQPGEGAIEPAAAAVDIKNEHSDDDAAWVAANLRCENGKPYRDIANVVRVLMTHPDFAGRFWFNKAMAKVVDRGTIMLDWQVDALAADLQERFLPEISELVVGKAVVIAANLTDRFAK